MTLITARTRGLGSLEHDLTRLNPRRGRQAMRRIWRLKQRATISRILRTQVDGRGAGFKPLAPKYKRAKARKVGVRPILVRSGRMVRSLSGGSGRHRVIRAFRMEFGSRVEYSGYHADGTRAMPQRDFIGWSEAELDEAEILITNMLADQLEGK